MASLFNFHRLAVLFPGNLFVEQRVSANLMPSIFGITTPGVPNHVCPTCHKKKVRMVGWISVPCMWMGFDSERDEKSVLSTGEVSGRTSCQGSN